MEEEIAQFLSLTGFVPDLALARAVVKSQFDITLDHVVSSPQVTARAVLLRSTYPHIRIPSEVVALASGEGLGKEDVDSFVRYLMSTENVGPLESDYVLRIRWRLPGAVSYQSLAIMAKTGEFKFEPTLSLTLLPRKPVELETGMIQVRFRGPLNKDVMGADIGLQLRSPDGCTIVDKRDGAEGHTIVYLWQAKWSRYLNVFLYKLSSKVYESFTSRAAPACLALPEVNAQDVVTSDVLVIAESGFPTAKVEVEATASSEKFPLKVALQVRELERVFGDCRQARVTVSAAASGDLEKPVVHYSSCWE